MARSVSTKLVGRHPHVFGDATSSDASADEVASRWEDLKQAEKGRASIMDGIPAGLPSLLLAAKVQRKIASRGVDWRGLVARDAAVTDGGRKLLEVVDESCRTGGDPETDLRVAAEHLRDAFRAHEARG